MNPPADPSAAISTWDCHAGDVKFRITAAPTWLAIQRAYLSEFLTAPPGHLDLAAFSIRVHTDDMAYTQIVEAVTNSASTCDIEPVPGLVIRQSHEQNGLRCFAIIADDVEHRPGAYAVTTQGHAIDLFTHSGTPRPHRYPIRLIREAMLRTYEDAGGVVFHAAGVDIAHAGVMICGRRGTGKTTMMSALLGFPNAALLSNDRIVTCWGEQMIAVPLPVPTARGTIQAFPELENGIRRNPAVSSELDRMPADFGSTIKHAFTAYEFAAAFGGHLISRSAVRLIVVPRLSDTDEPAHVRRISPVEARHVLAANCFTPRDEFWVQPWLVPRRSTDDQLRHQANTAIEHITASVPCVEVSFGVRNPISDLITVLQHTMGGVR
ncbi:MAG TPA: hypothetical protein VF444_05275 [Pseudonocardiaceae bacterium]